MDKIEVSGDALGRIEFINRAWAGREYRRLSPNARRLFDNEVNKIFWLKNPERYDKKLDPTRSEDTAYRDKWIKISHSLIGGTGAQYWEKKVKEDQDLRREAERYSEKVLESLDRQQAKEKPLTSTERAARGILRKEFTGKEFLEYIDTSFKEPYAEPEQVAFNITRYAEQRHLVNASRDPDGLKGLFQLYGLLISDSDNKEYIQQANRIMAAIGTLSDPSTGLLDKPYIFPAQFTLFNSSHITARLTEDNKIWVKLNQHSTDGHQEGLSAGIEAFTTGITLEPHEWVRFKLYDEGGITICRPAIYLLQLSNKSTSETWSNMINVGSLGLPGGPLLRVGGIVGRGASRAVVALSRLEKAADILANGFILGNIVVRENRGWLIENYGDKGRKFIEYFDIAATVATFYGLGKAMSTPVLRKSLEHMTKNWDDIKSSGFDPEDASKISQIDKSVNEFKAVLKEYEGIDDAAKAIDEGAERAVRLDESVSTARTERAKVREATRTLDRVENTNSALRNLETNPDYVDWVWNRDITSKEFRNWINNLPEESRAGILRLLQDTTSPGRLRIKRFVLRDAAHEIRVNKELRKMGIDQVHGDFIGPGNKAKPGIAEILSRNAQKGDEAVDAAVKAHGEGRVHHNPVIADDYLHQALDQCDAVADQLRATEGYGYRKSRMEHEDIRKIFVTKEKDIYKKKAMEAVLDYKEKGIDPRKVRRDYHDFFAKAKTQERITPRDGTPPGPEYSTTQPQPKKDLNGLSQTRPPLPYSRVNVKYLGENLADKINSMGVDEKFLDEYVWRLNWESSKGDPTEIALGRVQEGVKKTINQQVESSLTLGENLAGKLVKYGYDPSDISASINELAEKGIRPSQIRETLRKETLMMDYLRDQLHGGSQGDARISILASDGDVKSAIKQKLWENMVEGWNKTNPKFGPGAERLVKFSDEAEQMTKNIEKKILGGGGLSSGAVITQLRQEKKESLTEAKESKQQKDATEHRKLYIRETTKQAQQKNLKENKKPKNMKPFF